ncbi:M61 family metallopeptidase [Roseateles sp. BYS180W]|uniref:M61 family metallopeptidase n=1 Tax=Roseateles rivi TaxID=3299028 RepID=A0ABW7FS62_9BURK
MVHYRIAPLDEHAHLFEVTLTLSQPQSLQVLSLPVWIPGSYMVREFSRHLGAITARQGGRELACRQTEKNRWEVACQGPAALELSYRVYAFDTSVRTAYLDAQRAFFNPTSLCLRAHGFEDAEHRIELSGWAPQWRVATAMPERGPGLYCEQSYEAMADHPFELGEFWSGSFEAGGAVHELVVSGQLPVADLQRLLQDTQRICQAQLHFWHGAKPTAPMQRYVFMLNCIEEGYGGLEHRASTALLASRRDLPRLGQPEVSDGYLKLLGLISHEYFHTWNVKRLRPRDFAQLDFDRENYTELLWLFEGFTSYYDELMLVRAGLLDEARYLKLMAAHISQVLASPGRLQHSLAQSSLEAWTKYYRPDENTLNAVVSYYSKGALLALALDLSLRSQDQAPSSLDELMRQLWAQCPDRLVQEADVLAAVGTLGSAALAEQVRQWVHGTDDLPLPALLERMGLRWSHEAMPLAQQWGLRVSEEGGALRVKNVLHGGAALQAGLHAGDEIVACNGWRVRKLDDLPLTLQGQAPSQLRLSVARDQRMLELTLQLPSAVATASAPVTLSVSDKATTRAQKLRRAWLGA